MPNPKTKEQRAAQQRLCQKRRYIEIKNDPDLLAKEKERRKAIYQRRKEEMKSKPIAERTPRAQRNQRKKWKENSKRYRQRQKENNKKNVILESVQIQGDNSENIDPTALSEDPLQDIASTTTKIRQIRYKELRKRKLLMEIIRTLKKNDDAQRKKISRLEKRVRDQNSLIKKLQYKNNDDTNNTSSPNELEKFNRKTQSNIQAIKDFYIDDSNSTIRGGKKEYISTNQVRMQKRFLTGPLSDLYQKFKKETNIKVSYSFFCKLRPFWVLFPRPNMRETCLCTTI